MPTETQAAGMPPQAAAIYGIISFLFMIGIVTSYVIMLVAVWRGMRAHQKIAKALEKISEKLDKK